MILAGGHYKQTQNNYIIVALINIVISIITVKLWGLIGVAIGTLVAMLYQTVWMAYYDSKNLIKWPFRNFLKQIVVDFLSIGVAVITSRWISIESINYLSWAIMAMKIAIVMFAVVVVINSIFYRDKIICLKNRLFQFTKR